MCVCLVAIINCSLYTSLNESSERFKIILANLLDEHIPTISTLFLKKSTSLYDPGKVSHVEYVVGLGWSWKQITNCCSVYIQCGTYYAWHWRYNIHCKSISLQERSQYISTYYSRNLSSLIWSLYWYLIKSINYGVPHYAIFSTYLFLLSLLDSIISALSFLMNVILNSYYLHICMWPNVLRICRIFVLHSGDRTWKDT